MKKKDKNNNGFESLLNIIATIISILTVGFTLVLTIYKIYFAEIASSFYGIPKIYYSIGQDSNIVFIILFVSAVACVFLLPVYLNKIDKNSKTNIILSRIYCFELCVISLALIYYSITLLICGTLNIFDGTISIFKLSMTLIVIAVLTIASCLAVYYYFKDSFNITNEKNNENKKKDNETKDSEKTNKNITPKNDNKEQKVDKEKINYQNYLLVAYLIILIGLYFATTTNIILPKYIRDYEVVKLDDGSEKLIVCHYGDNAILIDFKEAIDDKNSILLSRGEYCIKSIDGLNIFYKHFNNVINN